MGWTVPAPVPTGHHVKSKFWETLQQNQYFRMQHRQHTEGKHLRKMVTKVRGKLTNKCNFRIILNAAPWHVIAWEETEADIQRRWNFLETTVIQDLGRMQGNAWYHFMIYWATQRARGQTPHAPAVPLAGGAQSSTTVTMAATVPAAAATAPPAAMERPVPLAAPHPAAATPDIPPPATAPPASVPSIYPDVLAASAPPEAAAATAGGGGGGGAAAEDASAPPSDNLCKVCYENDAENAMVPCGHQVLCSTCAANYHWDKCPICRTPVTATMRIYRT